MVDIWGVILKEHQRSESTKQVWHWKGMRGGEQMSFYFLAGAGVREVLGGAHKQRFNGMSLVHLHVTRSRSRDGLKGTWGRDQPHHAGAVVTWVSHSQSVLGDLQASGKCEILKVSNTCIFKGWMLWYSLLGICFVEIQFLLNDYKGDVQIQHVKGKKQNRWQL